MSVAAIARWPFAAWRATCYRRSMMIAALLLAMPASMETGSLGAIAGDVRQTCGIRRTGSAGSELVDVHGVVVVDVRLLEEAERLSPVRPTDGVRYCVSLRGDGQRPRVTSFAHVSPFPRIGR